MQLQPRAGRADPDAAGPADARPHEVRRRPRAWRKGAYVLADAAGRQAGRDPAGHRQRGRRSASRPTSSSRPRASRPASSACRRGSCSSDQDAGVPRQRAAARRHGPGLGRAGVDLRLGALRRARRARCIGMQTFGASAPLKDLQKKFGFTVERVVEAAKDQLRQDGDVGSERRGGISMRIAIGRRPWRIRHEADAGRPAARRDTR